LKRLDAAEPVLGVIPISEMAGEDDEETRRLRNRSKVNYRQGCEACLCKCEAVAEGWLCGDAISKRGVLLIAEAIAQIVAFGAHTFQLADSSRGLLITLRYLIKEKPVPGVINSLILISRALLRWW